MRLLIPRNRNTLLQLTCRNNRHYSTTSPSQQKPPPPRPSQQRDSKLLPTTVLLVGGAGAGLAAYYYYDPNAEVFKQAKKLVGMGDEGKRVGVISKAALDGVEGKQRKGAPVQELKRVVSPAPVLATATSILPPPPPLQQTAPPKQSISPPPPPLPQIPASATAASAINTSREGGKEDRAVGPDHVPKNVLVTALRAQQEALSESHEAKVKTIQMEYDRRLSNAAQIIEAERVVELRGKYEKASAALSAIENGIEARTAQNDRAKRLRSLWAQVNALHARVNHPEYHSSTITSIDKPALLRSIQIPDKFVTQMVDSLPTKPVHSLESLKDRFYNDVAPVAKSVGLIKDGEGFSLWKYFLGRVFSRGVVGVGEGKKPSDHSPSTSRVQSTADALDSARRSLDKSDLVSAAIAVNGLSGLPRQVASDWLADARTLLETNQTLFVLMTYAASNNVF